MDVARLVRTSTNPEGVALSTYERNTPPSDDAVIDALDDASRAVEDNVSDEADLLAELDHVRRDRIAGVPMREVIGDAGQPRALVLLTRAANRIFVRSGRLRRAFVRSLVEEGETVNSVAKRFGVTRQRIATILRPPKE